MRIGVIGSVSKPTRYDTAGGVEVWTSLFLLESIKRGHTFDLYALKDSLRLSDDINLIEVANQGVDEIKNSESFKKKHPREYDSASLLGIFFSRIMILIKENEQKYDIIVNSSGSPLFTVNWDLYRKPLLTIGHFAAFEPYVSYFEYFPLPPNIFYTFPSLREFRLAKEIPDAQKFHIPHGVDIGKLPFEEGKKQRILWFGRLDQTMPKGVSEAIDISNKMKISLDIYTYIEDTNYFSTNIKPLLTKYTNFQTGIPRSKYFKEAKLFLLPLRWEEPFGLTILESMSSGTPVVAYAKGAIPEIIKDGETGFIVNSTSDDKRGDWIIKKTGVEGLCEAVEKIYAMSDDRYKRMRKDCRKRVENNFTVAKMVDSYEDAYQKMLIKN